MATNNTKRRILEAARILILVVLVLMLLVWVGAIAVLVIGGGVGHSANEMKGMAADGIAAFAWGGWLQRGLEAEGGGQPLSHAEFGLWRRLVVLFPIHARSWADDRASLVLSLDCCYA